MIGQQALSRLEYSDGPILIFFIVRSICIFKIHFFFFLHPQTFFTLLFCTVFSLLFSQALSCVYKFAEHINYKSLLLYLLISLSKKLA